MRQYNENPIYRQKLNCPHCDEKDCYRGRMFIGNCVQAECEKCGEWGLVLLIWEDEKEEELLEYQAGHCGMYFLGK